MLKLTFTAAIFLALAYLIFCAMLFVMQRSMLYYPTPETTNQESEVTWLEHDGNKLKVWNIQGSGDDAIIYFGGNAEDVALNIAQLKRLLPTQSIYLHNYRGYGGSSGSPSESALFNDAIALYDKVAQDHKDIAVIGRSLGTGVAVYLASQRPVQKLTLVTPFDSMARVASGIYPFIPVSLLLHDNYNSLDYAQELKSETLILIAEHDEVIPRERTDSLVKVLPRDSTTVKVILNTDHNTISNSRTYEKALVYFFLTEKA